ncbi:MAG: branched-chain amino acid ABC transporter permease [Deltaproteobacteria bacterium]|nr:branched-chain amino acid ABC transporter permease [Deltaproteobacteria bacterium]
MARVVKWALPFVLALGFPFVGQEGYFTHLAITILIFSILASSLNLLMGYTGLVSIAHGAFYGIGAYTSGILVLRHGVPFWAAIVIATAFAGIVALGIGPPSFRTRGIYYIIVTIAFQLIASEIFDNWYSMTGGGLGLKGIPRPEPISLPFLPALGFQSKFVYYYLVLAVAAAVHYGIWRIIRSPLGIALMAIRDNETKALMMGLSPLRYKIGVFVFASALAGLAGSLYAHYLEYAHPDLFSFFVSVDVFLMVMLGGAGTLYGPPLGVLILEMLREVLHEFVALRLLLYGLLLIVIIVFLPEGLPRPLARWARRLVTPRLLPGSAP